MAARLVLLLLSVGAATLVFSEPARLLQVQIMIRHGDRAPMYEFTAPTSERAFPRGLGELTDEGLKHASEQGLAFRRHYEQIGLLNQRTRTEDIYIRSSPIKRVLMSAASFSTSFLSKSLNKVRLPRIFTTNDEEDEKVLIVHDSREFRCEVLARHNISDAPECRSTLLKARIVREYPTCADFTYSKIEAAIAEVESGHVKLDAALEACARGAGRTVQFRSLCVRPGIGAEFSLPRAKAAIGPLVAIMARNVDDAVRSDTIEGAGAGAAMRIYYTHDHNILSVAQALGILGEFHERNPEFSAAIAIETWSSSEGFDVKIVLKDGVAASFKPVAKFRFLDFKAQIGPYTEGQQSTDVQWDRQLSRVYSFAEFGRDVGHAVDASSTSSSSSSPESAASEASSTVSPSSSNRKTLTLEILLIAAVVFGVIAVLVRRRPTYTRMY